MPGYHCRAFPSNSRYVTRLRYIYPRFRVSFWVRSQLETYLFFSPFGPELNGLNFFGIALFYSGHSAPHLEFQNGGGFGPHLREVRMALTRVGPLWVYPAGIKPKCERAPLT